MAVPVEFFYVFIPGVVAIVELWYYVYSSRIKEKQRDLVAGQDARLNFVKNGLSTLKDELTKSATAIEGMRNLPTAKETGKLLEDLKKVVDSVEEIDTVQDAQDTCIRLMKTVRDRVVIFMIGGAVITLLVVVGTWLPDVYSGAINIIGLLVAYALVALSYNQVWMPFQESKTIGGLLLEKELERQGNID